MKPAYAWKATSLAGEARADNEAAPAIAAGAVLDVLDLVAGLEVDHGSDHFGFIWTEPMSLKTP